MQVPENSKEKTMCEDVGIVLDRAVQNYQLVGERRVPVLGRWPTDEELNNLIEAYGPMTCEEIAVVVGCSKQYISAQEQRTMRKFSAFVTRFLEDYDED